MKKAPKITETDWGLRVELAEGQPVNDDNYLQHVDHIIAHCRRTSAGKVLILAHGTRRRLSLFRMIEGIELLRQLPFVLHLAVVSPEIKQQTDSAFMTTAAMNRGVRFTYHDTEEEALAQLLTPRQPRGNAEFRSQNSECAALAPSSGNLKFPIEN